MYHVTADYLNYLKVKEIEEAIRLAENLKGDVFNENDVCIYSYNHGHEYVGCKLEEGYITTAN